MGSGGDEGRWLVTKLVLFCCKVILTTQAELLFLFLLMKIGIRKKEKLEKNIEFGKRSHVCVHSSSSQQIPITIPPQSQSQSS